MPKLQPVLRLPEIGETVAGRYQIVSVLGRGGFGRVYRAHQVAIGRDVALKCMAPELAHDPKNIERFRREALHISQLCHPNTVTLYDYGQTDEGLFYIVMEMVEGRALSEVIAENGGLGSERTFHILIQIAQSLAEAHQHAIVHRDLKPENIILCDLYGDGDYVKVLDFGLAKAIHWDGSQPGLTAEGKVFGTPMYMAPEQVCGEEITAATDVYALGLLAFEMLTGKPPVVGKSRIAVLRSQLNDPVPHMPPDLQRHALGKVITKAVRKPPRKRFKNAGELVKALVKARGKASVIPPDRSTAKHKAQAVSSKSDRQTSLEKRQDKRSQEQVVSSALDIDIDIDVDFGLVSDVGDVLSAGLDTYGTPRQAHPSSELPLLESHDEDELADSGVGATVDLGVFCRGAELTLLKRWVEGFQHGEAAEVVTCFGEPGAGKSRLLSTWRVWLNNRAPEPRPLCGMAVCRPNLSHPLEPIREAMLDIMSSLTTPVPIDPATGADGAAARALVDRFLEGRQELKVDARLRAGLTQWLESASKIRPIVLLLDDVEEATGAILALLADLLVVVEASDAALKLVMAGSSDAIGLNPELAALLKRVRDMGSDHTLDVPLERLGRQRCDAFVDRILPSSQRLKKHVFQLSQGNPLFVVQILRYLHGTEVLVEQDGVFDLVVEGDDGSAPSVPPDLLDLLTLRIDQAVDRHTQQPGLKLHLQWLALLGMQAPVSLLEHARGIRPGSPASQRLRDDLDILATEGLIRMLPGDDRLVMFDHGLVRESLLKELSGMRSAGRLHRAAAEAKLSYFEERGEAVPYLEAAHHFLEAGSDEQYRINLLKAAIQARAHLERHRARDICFELLRTLDDESDPDGMLRLDTWATLGELCESLGELGPAEDYYRLATQSAAQRKMPDKQAGGLLGSARVLGLQNRLSEAAALALEALNLAQADGSVLDEISALITWTDMLSRLGDNTRCDSALEQLVDLLPNVDDDTTVGRALLHLGEIAKRRNERDASIEYQQAALSRFTKAEDPQGVSDALTALGFHAVDTGHNDLARKRLTRALEIKRGMGDQLGIGQVLNNLGLLAFKTGDHDTAEAFLRESIGVFRATGLMYKVGSAIGNLALVFMFRGRFPQADAYFEEALKILESVGDKLGASVVLTNQGLVAMNRCDSGRARRLFREARRLKLESGSRFGLTQVLVNLAFVAAWDGEFPAAIRLLQQLLEGDEPLADDDAAVARSVLAVVLAVSAQMDEAQQHIDEALRHQSGNEEHVRTFVTANAAFVLGTVGRVDEAEQLLAGLAADVMLASVAPSAWLRWLRDMASSPESDLGDTDVFASIARLTDHFE